MRLMDPAVRAVELSKSYRLYSNPRDRFLEIFGRPRHTVFPALEGVSFEVGRGETVGLIGQNGAGKSTLLKLLCGVSQPTSGVLETDGSIASILELGMGFHPEFSGRDNAALNAAILGLSPSEIRRALPRIMEFSELGRFLDQPVKTYSSGMYMRLAFSVAVNVEPDILIIDEALAVGDGHFQKKCVDKIREFQQRGRTIVFCSHSLYYISTLCSRTIWLDQGSVRRIGPSVDVIHDYEAFLLEKNRKSEQGGEASSISPVRIREFRTLDRDGKPAREFSPGDDIELSIIIESDIPSQPIHVIAGVHRSADDMQCFAVGTHADGLPPLSGQRLYDVRVRLHEVPLLRGDYTLILYAGDEHALHVFDRKESSGAFTMRGERFEIGVVSVQRTWDVAEHVETLVS
jgi:lipopolysaccharide transport system ATP-binding protein